MGTGTRAGHSRAARVVLTAMLLAGCAPGAAQPAAEPTTSAPLAESSLPASRPLGVNPATGNFYSYAPSIVEQGNVRHVFYCGNRDSGKVHDHVMLSVGRREGTTWTYSAPRVAFGPDQGPAWANYHMCDPQVLRGRFEWNGHVYPWAMFFTAYGCRTQAAPCPPDQESPNQLGVAFSDSLDAGPSGWKVYPTPLISAELEFGTRCPAGHYCVGQPAATSIDGAGRLLLFYQGNGFVRREVDLSNMATPVIGPRVPLPAAGLPDWLHNASVLYRPDRDRFFISYDAGVWNKDPNGPPVQTDTVLASIEGAAIWSGSGTWRVEERITPAHSGHAFNHNSGLVQTPFGTTPSTTLEVVHTVANGWTPSGGWGVWTYRLWFNTYPMP